MNNWVEIIRKDKGKYPNSYLAIFQIHDGIEKYCIITKKVLKYLNVTSLEVGDKLFVIKTFGDNGKHKYLPKLARKD